MNSKISKSICVILCDPSDWQRVLIAEYVLSQKHDKQNIVILDLEEIGENFFKTVVRKLGKNSKFKDATFRSLQSIGYEFYSIKNFQALIFSIWKTALVRLPKLITSTDPKFRYIYPTLVNQTGLLVIPSKRYRKLILSELLKSRSLEKYLQSIDTRSVKRAIIVNGRFSKAMTLRNYFGEHSIKVDILEFASTQERFEVFDVSPHSNAEMARKMKFLWANASDKTRCQIAEKYFQTFRNLDPSAGISWNHSMVPGSIPKFPSEKRILTFYSTSESEFIGVRDKIPSNLFQNQAEALETILSLTSPKEWVVYLRRHPKRPGSLSLDIEEHVWKKCREYPHLIEIEPNAAIDSYELGLKSEIVAHFDSSIGPQLIHMGHQRVITLGNTIWEDLDARHHLRDKSALEKFLADPFDYHPNLEPWAYFRASYGEPIQNFKLNNRDMTWVWQPSSGFEDEEN